MRLTPAEQKCLLQGVTPTEEEIAQAQVASPVPYPDPKTWHEVQENRRVAFESGAIVQHGHIRPVVPAAEKQLAENPSL